VNRKKVFFLLLLAVPIIGLCLFADNSSFFARQDASENTAGPGGLDPPTQVHLTWQRDPAHTVTVSWKTLFDTVTHTVKYGYEQGHHDLIAKGFSHESPNQLTGRIHHVELQDLPASTTVYYICGDYVGGWSNEYSFRTPPEGSGRMTFTVSGDDGTTSNAVEVVNRIASVGGSFHIHTGDLSCANGVQPLWDTWFAHSETLFAHSPVIPCIGNHEDESHFGFGFTTYLGRLALPGNERWYSLDCGQIHFASIDYESDFNPGSAQYDWLEADLKAASEDPTVEWIITFDHKPPYSSSEHGSSEGFRNAICPLLDKYDVDIHFSGHDHNYERSYPLKNKEVTTDETSYYVNPEGTIYVVSGGGGRWLYNSGKNYWTIYSESCHHYCQVDVYPKGWKGGFSGMLHLSMQRVNDCPVQYLYDGNPQPTQLRDEFWIVRHADPVFDRPTMKTHPGLFEKMNEFVKTAYELRNEYLYGSKLGRECARIYYEWGVEALQYFRDNPSIAAEAKALLTMFLREFERNESQRDGVKEERRAKDTISTFTFDDSFTAQLQHLWDELYENASPGFQKELETLKPYIDTIEGKSISEVLNRFFK
jgi:hypothetical protein